MVTYMVILGSADRSFNSVQMGLNGLHVHWVLASTHLQNQLNARAHTHTHTHTHTQKKKEIHHIQTVLDCKPSGELCFIFPLFSVFLEL